MPYIGRHLDRGNYLKLDDISSSFDGVETTFNLTNGGSPFYPGSAFSILVVLAGVIQEAESAYQIDQSQITFASAPLASDSFFCIVLGTALGINVPGNGTVGGTQLTKPFSYDGFFYLNDTTNRVGINSSSPTTALDVQGTVTATQFIGNISNTSGISTFYNLTVENDLTVNGSFSTLDTIVTEVDKLEVGANNSTVGVAITQSGSGDILRLYDSATQVVTVKDGGNVGIGSQTPQATLDVASTTPVVRFTDTDAGQYTELLNSGSSFYISADRGNGGNGDIIFRSGGTSEKVRITSSGNVGINTTDATHQVTVVSSAANNTIARFKAANLNPNFDIVTDASSHGAAYVKNNIGATKVALLSNGSSYFTGGSVGIGTDNPAQKLDVIGGNIRIGKTSNGKYIAENSLGQSKVVIDSLGNSYLNGGNVGIGTDNPQSKLDVNGNVLPSFDATHDLGSASKRWNNVYTTDLQLSNEGSSNDVDGSWGRWTIQEGEDDLFLINRRNGKKYKFVLQEVN